MSSDTYHLKQIIEKEKELGLYDKRVFGFPFYRIVRFKVRTKYLHLMTGFQYNTTKNQLRILSIIKTFFTSAKEYSILLFKHRNQFENIIFAFPRLQKVGDYYMDKFTDPIIQYSGIKDSCLIFQRPLAGSHKPNRYNSQLIVKTDFIEVTAKFLSLLLFPVISLFYIRKISNTFLKAKGFFKLNIMSLLYFCIALSSFIISYQFHYYLLKKLKPKRVFLVDREIFFPVILACKKQGIIVYEIQHGVTHGETAVYSGEYDPSIDPDYFLSFGEAWFGPQFGIPIKQIINIGWAYKNVINEFINSKKFNDNTILVISEPHISSKILSITENLAKIYKDYIFHIRLHPQENLTEEQIKYIYGIDNISIQSNAIESSIAIMSYTTLIGENSSVLYEALSFGKKVGRLCFGGLDPEIIEGENIDGFTYIRSLGHFEAFLKYSNTESTNAKLVYSDFDSMKVDGLL